MNSVGTALIVAASLGLVGLALWRIMRSRDLGTNADRATFTTLHTASLASPPLREGLTASSAERSLRHLRHLLGAPAVALSDTTEVLGWDGTAEHHRGSAGEIARRAVESGKARSDRLSCDRPGCSLRHVITAPLICDGDMVGTIQVFSPVARAALVRATGEIAHWISGQLELAAADLARRRMMDAQVRALRAQISPHFVYNSLTAIASFVRTDPERARQLLLDFADFTRYSFRRHADFTTLADELTSIERYLVLEKARFGDRLQVTLRIAPEALPVTLPFMSLQPLVENAVRHGIEQKGSPGRLTILAQDAGPDVLLVIEDDGVGDDPDRVRRALEGDADADSIGLSNVDERLRTTFGDDYGLVVETGPGMGTKVTVRVPKYSPGVHR